MRVGDICVMFKVKWDIENNGVILSDYIEEKDALNAPRPVYVEELKMLELDKVFKLPIFKITSGSSYMMILKLF